MTSSHPSLRMADSSWFPIDSSRTEWTKEENKLFESALAIYDENTPHRWLKVAAMIPGKTEWDVIQQYKELVEDVSEIEAGRVPLPGYHSSSFTLELVDSRDYGGSRKSSLSARGSDKERKKGVPWTIDEHRRFLMGLVKYGKGDWRNISRNFVITKTPTQVASHAQKYYIRQHHSGAKDRRRPSIHDIKISTLTEDDDDCDDTRSANNRIPALNEASMVSTMQRVNAAPKVLFNWNHPSNGKLVFLNANQGSLCGSTPCDTTLDQFKLQEYVLYDDDAFYGTYM